jgi:AcrR family transcriptional regulator
VPSTQDRYARAEKQCAAAHYYRSLRRLDFFYQCSKFDLDRMPTLTKQPVFVPPEPPRTPKSADTRRRLLAVAGELFIERGYSAVSIRDIAARAKLTNGAVYGHFRSKGQLLVEVIRTKIAESDFAYGSTDGAAEPLHGVELLYDKSRREIRLLEVDAAVAARNDPDIAAGLRSLYDERHVRIRDAMAELRDPDAAAWLVSVLTGGIGMKEAAGLPRPDDERLHELFVHILPGALT